jgi:hypothetical protein
LLLSGSQRGVLAVLSFAREDQLLAGAASQQVSLDWFNISITTPSAIKVARAKRRPSV